MIHPLVNRLHTTSPLALHILVACTNGLRAGVFVALVR